MDENCIKYEEAVPVNGCRAHYTEVVGGSYQYPANWHNDIEILFCLGGEGCVHLENRIFNIRAGNFYVVNSRILHRITSQSFCGYIFVILSYDFFSECHVNFHTLEFAEYIESDEELAALFIKARAIDQGDYFKFDEFLAAYTPNDERLARLCPNVGETKRSADSFLPLRLRNLSIEIFLQLCSRYLLSENAERISKSPAMIHVQKSITFIFEHYSEHITLDQLAKLASVNKYQLSKEFKALTQMTIVEYLNNLRCRMAKQKLSEGMNVQETAYACGFSNASYFTKIYMRHIGALPSTHKSETP